MGKVITIIGHGSQSVQVVKVDGMIGYRFDAVGRESLPLAVELAVLQTQNPWRLAEMVTPVVLGRKG